MSQLPPIYAGTLRAVRQPPAGELTLASLVHQCIVTPDGLPPQSEAAALEAAAAAAEASDAAAEAAAESAAKARAAVAASQRNRNPPAAADVRAPTASDPPPAAAPPPPTAAIELLRPGSPQPGWSAAAASASKPRLPQRRKEFAKSFYTCTVDGCGWSGKTPSVHAVRRPKCWGMPCTVLVAQGGNGPESAAAFRARCTPKQREQGLPPDGEKPVVKRGADGEVDLTKLYLTVPLGLSEGNTFEVPTGRGSISTLTVPAGIAAGDVIMIPSCSESADATRKRAKKHRP